jgi:hypothetical protein
MEGKMKIAMVKSEKRLRRSVIGHVVVLSFSFLLINSFHVGAQTSLTIDYNVTTLCAGWHHTVGLKEDGTVVAVGWNADGQLDVSGWTNIKSIAAGCHHTVGLKEDGTVVAVGQYWHGELDVSGWTNIKSIAAGYNHTVGLKEDGTVVAVGENRNGELDVSGWTNIKSIAAGDYHTVGLKEDGTVVAVGSNWGQLDFSGWTNIKSIAAGLCYTVGLKEDGTVVAVGDNSWGQLDVSGWTNIRQPCYLPPTNNTQPGTNVSVTPDLNVTITFNEVTGVGNTTVTVSNTNPGSEKIGFKFLDTYYDISTTATYSGLLTVCLKYDDSNIPAGSEEILKIFHWDGTDWIDVTFSLDTVNNIICAQVSSLSWFAAAYELDSIAPTTNISLSGTLGKNGWYVSNVQVALTATDNEGGSGVAKTEYSFDGFTWNTYTAPFMVSTEGTTSVYYRSTDEAGNVEETKTEAIKIDKTLPVPDVQILPDLSGECSVEIAKIPTATDNCDGKIAATTADPLEYKTQGTYLITWIYSDKAGNVAMQTQTVTVHDITAPAISASDSVCVTVGNGNKKSNKIMLIAQDNCSKNLTLQITKVEVFNNGGNLVNGNGIYEISGNTVYVNPNGNGWTVKITAIAADEFGNTAPVTITKTLLKC